MDSRDGVTQLKLHGLLADGVEARTREIREHKIA